MPKKPAAAPALPPPGERPAQAPFSRLSKIRMVAKWENHYRQVIDREGRVQRWVGIGWVDQRDATPDDYRTIPEIDYDS